MAMFDPVTRVASFAVVCFCLGKVVGAKSFLGIPFGGQDFYVTTHFGFLNETGSNASFTRKKR